MFTDLEYEELAILSIFNYFDGLYPLLDIKANYPLAIKLFVSNIKSIQGAKVAGVKSMSEGNQSMTFTDGVEAFVLTNDVLALLPKKINFRVW